MKFEYQWDLSFSPVCVNLSEACSLGSFFIFGHFAGPLLTVGLHCAIVCASAACIACADPLTVLCSLSSGDVSKCRLVSSSEDSQSDK